MAHSAWYAVQVPPGKERMMAQLIEQTYRESMAAAFGRTSLPAEETSLIFGQSFSAADLVSEFEDTPPAADSVEVPRGGAEVPGGAIKEPKGAAKAPSKGVMPGTYALTLQPFHLDECFAPCYITQKKQHGIFVDVKRQLIPGYIIAVTDNPAAVARMVSTFSEFCQVVTCGEEYLPLTACECEWLSANTSRGNRVVPMSFGHKEGDALVVDSGPLKGKEARITRIKRSASLAFLEFHVGSITIKTTVGLGVMPAG